MVTKGDLSSSKDRQQPFVNDHFLTDDCNFNLNLNESNKCPLFISVQSLSKLSNDKNCGDKVIVGIPKKTLNSVKINSCSSQIGLRSAFTTVYDGATEETKKRWKEETSISDVNKSTLSLHISAYENSFEDKLGNQNNGDIQKLGSIKKIDNAGESLADLKFDIQNQFEFPRQENNNVQMPEVSQYQASQRLINPNQTVKMTETKEISSDELAVYDRQIRLWGLEAQNRLRNSSVLIYGMTPLGAEIGKNLMLCGLNALTVADGCLVGENDANFLIDVKKDAGKNRALAAYDRLRVLNPLVKLETVKMRLSELTPDYLKKFDLVILIDQGKDMIKSVDAVCRENKIRFIAGGIFGWTGYAFFDFDGFEFLIPAPKDHTVVDEKKEDEMLAESPSKKAKLDDASNGKNIETVTLEEDNAKIKKSIAYPSFADSLMLEPEKLTKGAIRRLKPANFIIANACLHLESKLGHEISADDFRDFVKLYADNPLQKLATDALKGDFEVITDPPLPATSAIVGGVLAQEAIKSLSQNDTPHKNFFSYNAVESMGYIYDLPLIK